jgi:hypothetical protein
MMNEVIFRSLEVFSSSNLRMLVNRCYINRKNVYITSFIALQSIKIFSEARLEFLCIK